MKGTIGIAVLSVAALAGCGGGGSGTTASSTTTASSAAPTAPQGVYEGTTSTGYSLYTLVLENNQLWSLYGMPAASGLLVLGMVQGTGASSNGSFSATDIRNFVNDGSVGASGTLTASYVAGSKFDGSMSLSGPVGSGTVTFTGKAPITTVTYDYDKAASIADIAGAWTMDGLNNTTANLVVAPNGSFAATDSAGCTFSGTATPRASGKNVFDVNLTFGAAPCDLPGATATGIALTYTLSSGQRQLLAAAVNSDRTYGGLMFGTR